MELFVLIFERPCKRGCSHDVEIRLCKADTFQDAINIAKEHQEKYYKGWRVSMSNVNWDKDGTAYVYCDIK